MDDRNTRINWHDKASFGLHFDLHATAHDTVLGKDMTVESLVAELMKIRPDFVQCDCKGHPGYASYPSKVGIASPGIVKDAVSIWREASRKLGIPLVMHYSGLYDIAILERHPDWNRTGIRRISAEGIEYRTIKGAVCPISEYTVEYMIPQLLEIINSYDVDGFWMDGETFFTDICYCERCRAGFRTLSGIQASVSKRECRKTCAIMRRSGS
jgi:hypothetical protein